MARAPPRMPSGQGRLGRRAAASAQPGFAMPALFHRPARAQPLKIAPVVRPLSTVEPAGLAMPMFVIRLRMASNWFFAPASAAEHNLPRTQQLGGSGTTATACAPSVGRWPIDAAVNAAADGPHAHQHQADRRASPRMRMSRHAGYAQGAHLSALLSISRYSRLKPCAFRG